MRRVLANPPTGRSQSTEGIKLLAWQDERMSAPEDLEMSADPTSTLLPFGGLSFMADLNSASTDDGRVSCEEGEWGAGW